MRQEAEELLWRLAWERAAAFLHPSALLRAQKGHQTLGPTFSLTAWLGPCSWALPVENSQPQRFCLSVCYLNHFPSSSRLPPGPEGLNQIKPVFPPVPTGGQETPCPAFLPWRGQLPFIDRQRVWEAG